MNIFDLIFGEKSSASLEVVDREFVLSDLNENMVITDEDRERTAYYDRYAAAGDGGSGGDWGDIPAGKVVW